MSPYLDYAPPPPLRPRDFAVRVGATSPLWLGLIAYALLCVPAAVQRGYPPIDPAWTGVTYVWPLPVVLFVLFCPAGRFARVALLVYAVASGYVDACTVVLMVPHRFSFIGALTGSTLTIPVHLAGVAVTAWVGRRAVSRLDRPGADRNPSRRRAIRLAIAGAALVIGIALPFAYRLIAIECQERGGRERADADWAAQAAEVFSPDGWFTEHGYGDATVRSYFDAESGLPLRSHMHHGFEDAYNDRVRELVRLHGAPPWSQRSRFVSDADLVSMLDDPTMTPVTSFPYDAAHGIVLLRNGSVTRWGGTMGNGSNDLSIATQFSGLHGFGNSLEEAYVGRLARYPDVIFVRCGHKWVAACTADGCVLGYASRD